MGSTPDRTETDRPEPGQGLDSISDRGTRAGEGGSASAPGITLPVCDPDNYDVKGEIARGGMGRILEATDRRLDRPVAIKQLLVSSTRHARLFEREVRITARLQHPAIVNVYEAGTLPSGELFYAMKLVAGRPLSRVIQDTKSLSERLARLPAVTAVCEALAYAHEKRIIHRDLKPSNVLVGEFGETVVIDWGLAKDLGEEGDGADDDDPAVANTGVGVEHTVSGKAVGTPSYMPPEQARGERVDERSDVYSLGAMLYHLLTGSRPYAGESAKEIVADVCAGPPPPLTTLEPGIPGDLVALIERAMSRDPAQRYPSAVELAEDLRRFQTGQLVSAHRYSRGELVWRWIRRHRAEVSVVAIALLVVSVLLVIGARRIIRERDIARTKADNLTLAQARSSLDRDPASAIRALQLLPGDAPAWGAARVLASDARERGVGRAIVRHRAEVAHVVARGAVVATASEDGAVALREGDAATLLWSHDGPVAALIVSRDGRWLVSGGQDTTLRVRDLRAGTERTLNEHALPIALVATDGRTLASADSGGNVRSWSLETGEGRDLGGRATPSLAIAIDADGAILVAGRDGRVRIWPPGGESATEHSLGGPIARAHFGPEAVTLAAARSDGELLVWRPGQGEARTLERRREAPTGLLVSEDGGRLLVLSRSGPPRVWDLEGSVSTVLPHRGATHGAFLGDGLVATGGRDGVVRVWRGAAQASELRGHGAAITALTSTHGDRVYSGAADREVREWSVLPLSPRRLEGHSAWVSRVAYADANTLVTASWDSTVRIWDLATQNSRVLAGHTGAIRDLAVSADGAMAVTGGDDRRVRLWRLRDGGVRVLGSHQASVRAVAITTNGDRVASAGGDNTVRIWDPRSGRVTLLVGHAGAVTALAFAPDGERIASASEDGTARLWAADGRELRRVEHGRPVTAVAFAPDGRSFASGGHAGDVHLTPAGDGPDRALRGHTGPVRHLAFAPGGGRLASASDDMTARLWRVGGGESLVLAGHRDFVTRVGFDPRGRTVVTASEDGTVALWDAASGTRRVLTGGQWLGDVAISPDGARVAACGADRAVLVWRDDLPRDKGELRAWLRARVPGEPPTMARKAAP